MTISLSRLKMPLILWSTVTLFFAFQFILRLLVGILREDIIQKFSIDAVTYGQLAGFYYLGYAGMQIPIGLMLDRFNFRYVTFVAIMFTSIGMLTFSLASTWEFVLFGRFLTGAGSGVAILSIAKITKLYFPEKMQSLMIGFAFTIGLTGAVAGGIPTKMMFNNLGYDETLQLLAGVAAILAFLVLIISDKNVEKVEKNEEHISIKKAFRLLCNPTILSIGLFGGLMVGALEGFADVWAMPFFNHIYHYSLDAGTSVTSFVYIGMIFGGAFLGYLSDRFNSPIYMILITGILMSVVFIILFMNTTISYFPLASLMFGLGILCCYQVLVFSLTTKIVSKSSAGLAMSIVNCINMSFGHFFHKAISTILQNNWNGLVNEKNVPIYDLKTYILGLSPVPICCLIGTLGFWYLATRQKNGKLKMVGN